MGLMFPLILYAYSSSIVRPSVRPFVRSSVRPSVTNRFFVSSLFFSLDSSTSYTELGYIYLSIVSGAGVGLGGRSWLGRCGLRVYFW